MLFKIKARFLLIIFFAIALLLLLTLVVRLYYWDSVVDGWLFLKDKEKIKAFIVSFGWGAPFIFIAFQILQVIFAPVPGEATGIIGGYLFGILKGFGYSSFGLAVGSILNFYIGRFFGERYIRKWIPEKTFQRFDTLLKRQGVLVIFLLFIFPGFPKDYLCLFLGFSRLPFKVFFIMAAFGRMPGTLMLSIQGASFYHEMYGVLAVLIFICVIVSILTFYYRESLYLWIEKINGKERE